MASHTVDCGPHSIGEAPLANGGPKTLRFVLPRLLALLKVLVVLLWKIPLVMLTIGRPRLTRTRWNRSVGPMSSKGKLKFRLKFTW